MNYFRIKENSFLARVAAGKLRSRAVAMVLGHTVHLYGVTQMEFLSNESWVRHELKHVEQYQRYGVLVFLYKYLVQTLKYGYYNCPIEKEARAAEKDTLLLARFQLQEKNNGRV